LFCSRIVRIPSKRSSFIWIPSRDFVFILTQKHDSSMSCLLVVIYMHIVYVSSRITNFERIAMSSFCS